MSLTDDWSDVDVAAYRAFCANVGSPLDAPLGVWMNESACRAQAWNRAGDASGIFQLVPATARGLGWDTCADPHLAAFRALSVADQIAWAERYYGPHRGSLSDRGAVYVATFLPALLPQAGDPAYVLCSADPQSTYAWAYRANAGLDRGATGTITVADLAAAATRALNSPRGLELLDRVSAC